MFNFFQPSRHAKDLFGVKGETVKRNPQMAAKKIIPVVRLATAIDRPQAVGCLMRAFAKDPVLDWMCRSDGLHCDLFSRSVNESLDKKLCYVSTIEEKVVGVACWYKPGQHFDPPWYTWPAFTGWSWERLIRFYSFVTASDKYHPKVFFLYK